MSRQFTRRGAIKVLTTATAAAGGFLAAFLPEARFTAFASDATPARLNLTSLGRAELRATISTVRRNRTVEALIEHMEHLSLSLAPESSVGATIKAGQGTAQVLGLEFVDRSDSTRAGTALIVVDHIGQLQLATASSRQRLPDRWEIAGYEADVRTDMVRSAGRSTVETATKTITYENEGRRKTITHAEAIRAASDGAPVKPMVPDASQGDCVACVFLAGLALSLGCGYLLNQGTSLCAALAEDPPAAASCVFYVWLVGGTYCATITTFGAAGGCCLIGACGC